MIRYLIAIIGTACLAVPATMWITKLPLTPIGHAGQAVPVAAVIVLPDKPREARSFAWFVAHPNEIEPQRKVCRSAPVAAVDAAECSNAERASLHIFNDQMLAVLSGKAGK